MYFIAIISIIIVIKASAYEDIDDLYNYDKALNNLTELYQFIGCFIDKEPCTKTASLIKGHLLEMVMDGCAGCDLVQKHYAHLFFEAMKKQYPNEYLNYVRKYDPDGDHFSKLEKAISMF